MSFNLTAEDLEHARDQARRANNMQLCASCKTPFEYPRAAWPPAYPYPAFVDVLCGRCSR